MTADAPPGQPAVLVVDDDPEIRNTLQWVLEQEGCSVALAAGGEEALAQLASGMRPGLILLDLTMPVMGGEQFMRLRTSVPGVDAIPVYLFSASLGAAEKVAALGAAGTVAKPIRLEQLLALVDKHCR